MAPAAQGLVAHLAAHSTINNLQYMTRGLNLYQLVIYASEAYPPPSCSPRSQVAACAREDAEISKRDISARDQYDVPNTQNAIHLPRIRQKLIAGHDKTSVSR